VSGRESPFEFGRPSGISGEKLDPSRGRYRTCGQECGMTAAADRETQRDITAIACEVCRERAAEGQSVSLFLSLSSINQFQLPLISSARRRR
jgi:hypothetical protein